ncbi:MAG: CDP-alcohol phosphatidyltransferase family protein [Rhodospirillales bacterium]|nr:CDP-alcohol phosphatidyltransferase family protein [Rhodospirillales bacterium]
MKNAPWDQRAARILVRPLVHTPVTPNQVTIVTLIFALAGAGLLATGDAVAANWGVGLFVFARFLDHFDGELARQSGKTSKLGYYLDYISGALSYGALFACIGIGLRDSGLGPWAYVLGFAGTASALISMFLNLGIDAEDDAIEEGDAVGYPGFAGFELEDGIYLLAPITWLGFLQPFFVAAGIGATVYCLWTLSQLLRMRSRKQLASEPQEKE